MQLSLVASLVFAIGAAFAGGLVAQRLGLPVIVGYLLAGIAIGPFTPGPSADPATIGVLAEVGVAFLMFAVGAEFSRAALRELGRVATIGGPVHILATMALGPLLAPVLGLTAGQGLFLGGLMAMSSSTVAVKLLMARGEVQSLHGRMAVSLSVAQDLAVIPMVVLLPPLAVGVAGQWSELFVLVGKAALVVVGTFLVGTQIVPRILAGISLGRSRELFLLAIATFALGTGLITNAIGLSLAFGAFLAGLIVAESEYRSAVIAEMLPIRDLFVSLFFVSIGMLINPQVLVAQLGAAAIVSAAVFFGKSLIVTATLLLLGVPGRVALLAAVAIGQIGEFSFVLANVGVGTGAVPRQLFDITLATSIVSIVLTTLALRFDRPLLAGVSALPFVGRLFADPVEADAGLTGLRRHVVICGYGRVARELADVLQKRGFRFAVVEHNPFIVRQLRQRGTPVIYGDAGNPVVLEHAAIEHASLIAVLVPNPETAEHVTRRAREVNPRADIIARASDASDVERLRRAGADEVVQPEFEAGIEVIRHTLARFGISGPELVALLRGRRSFFYGSDRE